MELPPAELPLEEPPPPPQPGEEPEVSETRGLDPPDEVLTSGGSLDGWREGTVGTVLEGRVEELFAPFPPDPSGGRVRRRAGLIVVVVVVGEGDPEDGVGPGAAVVEGAAETRLTDRGGPNRRSFIGGAPPSKAFTIAATFPSMPSAHIPMPPSP